jgi:hypothetical protein
LFPINVSEPVPKAVLPLGGTTFVPLSSTVNWIGTWAGKGPAQHRKMIRGKRHVDMRASRAFRPLFAVGVLIGFRWLVVSFVLLDRGPRLETPNGLPMGAVQG